MASIIGAHNAFTSISFGNAQPTPSPGASYSSDTGFVNPQVPVGLDEETKARIAFKDESNTFTEKQVFQKTLFYLDDSIENEFSQVLTDIQENNQKISENEQDIEGLQSKTDELEEEVDGLTTTATELTTSTSTLHTRATALETDSTALNSRTTSLEATRSQQNQFFQLYDFWGVKSFIIGAEHLIVQGRNILYNIDVINRI